MLVAETIVPTQPASLRDRIDEVSTRLILRGATGLASVDFELLGQSAQEQGNDLVAAIARDLSRQIAEASSSDQTDLTRILSGGLVRMQALLKEPAVAATVESISVEPSEKTASQIQANAAIQSLSADMDLIREFVTESLEHLSTIEGQVLILEKNNTAAETLNSIFRAFHTIKGLAGFLEFADVQALAHEVETLLDLARTARLTVTSQVVDVVLESTDVLRQELHGIEIRLGGNIPPPSRINESLLLKIRKVSRGEVEQSGNTAGAPVASSISPEGSGKIATAPPAERRIEVGRSSDSSSSVRIDTAKLDQLMDMVGEMVIAQTLIEHSPALSMVQDVRFLKDLTHLARITSDVQRITTGMRMVPIGTQMQKTARLVRDLSRRAKKEIVLETFGEDTELDKTIAEELADPLLHMVRNSIDHGIEPPEERIALGKNPTARIRIAAYHQSGQIVVEISDDGRGLNREKILAKAQQNGLVQSGTQLTDNEIFLLIFEAGFSTADKVTDISGRGVGMDVVRKHVQKLRGRIDIQSEQGKGTTFYLKLPLTLAIIEGLVIVVGDQRYIVPIYSTKEILRPKAEMLSTVQGRGEMAMVHDTLLPIVRLHRRFEMKPRTTSLADGMLVVVESEGRQFCLFVDEVTGKQEVVIKSLGESFKNIPGIAGCAILGDGRVGLILDMDGISNGRS
ncbi:MAG: chemotaxis protein CheA [Acidobacteriaceae bacterium]|nr:chemotaxis protein CheA [Acidobacteriaceae bacterium]